MLRDDKGITFFLGDKNGFAKTTQGESVQRIITYKEKEGVKYYFNGKLVGTIKDKIK